jgi:hypothetical protein
MNDEYIDAAPRDAGAAENAVDSSSEHDNDGGSDLTASPEGATD